MAKKPKLPDDIREFFAKQGSRGGKIGGKMRMDSLTAEQRSELARKAAAARKPKAKKPKKATVDPVEGSSTKKAKKRAPGHEAE